MQKVLPEGRLMLRVVAQSAHAASALRIGSSVRQADLFCSTFVLVGK